MKIRKAKENDLKEMIGVYKDVFPVHNIFEKSEGDVFAYLKNILPGMIVAEDDGKVVGGLVIKETVNSDGWKVARLMHIAVSKESQNRGVGHALMEEAEKIVGKCKMEIHTEADLIDYYKKFGFEVEGTLKAHYGKGRDCVMLGKIQEE